MRSFSVGFHSIGDVEVLILVGEMDAYTVSEFEAAIKKKKKNGRYQIVVDGTQLLYISSAGFGAFVGYIEDIRLQGGDIKIAALRCHKSQIGRVPSQALEKWMRERQEEMAEGEDFELAEAFHREEILW